MSASRRSFLALLALATACATRPAADPEGSSAVPAEETANAEVGAADADSNPGQLASIRVGGAKLDVRVEGDTLECSDADLEFWVRRAAGDVSAYFGRFPVPGLKITIATRRRGAIGFGQHWDGRFLKIRVGPEATRRSFEHDWVLTHEMLHAAFPDLERRHKWMQEGLSTYLERLVQTRAGHWSEQDLWARWVSRLPIGRPRPGDRGFDDTRTWASLYWGGALYWFMADVEIRKATDNEKSLRDALIGILDAGGNGRVKWTTAQVVAAGDAATGTTVLRDLYAHMASAPGDVDLDAVFAQLGVSEGPDGEIVFDDDAELAQLRRAMTRDGS